MQEILQWTSNSKIIFKKFTFFKVFRHFSNSKFKRLIKIWGSLLSFSSLFFVFYLTIIIKFSTMLSKTSSIIKVGRKWKMYSGKWLRHCCFCQQISLSLSQPKKQRMKIIATPKLQNTTHIVFTTNSSKSRDHTHLRKGQSMHTNLMHQSELTGWNPTRKFWGFLCEFH